MVHAYLVRPFVYIQEMSYAVSGAVPVIDSGFPHELAGEHIELSAAGSFREFGFGESDESF